MGFAAGLAVAAGFADFAGAGFRGAGLAVLVDFEEPDFDGTLLDGTDFLATGLVTMAFFALDLTGDLTRDLLGAAFLAVAFLVLAADLPANLEEVLRAGAVFATDLGGAAFFGVLRVAVLFLESARLPAGLLLVVERLAVLRFTGVFLAAAAPRAAFEAPFDAGRPRARVVVLALVFMAMIGPCIL